MTGYFPGDLNNPGDHPNAGVTIGKGYDIGQHSPDEIARMGLSPKTTKMLQTFAAQPDGKGGYTPTGGQKAIDLLQQYAASHNGQKPTITDDEARKINEYTANVMFNDLGRRFSQASSKPFNELPGEAQTALADLAYNRGVGWLTSPKNNGHKIFTAATSGDDWQKVADSLSSLKTPDKVFNERAGRAATLIQGAIDAGTLSSATTP